MTPSFKFFSANSSTYLHTYRFLIMAQASTDTSKPMDLTQIQALRKQTDDLRHIVQTVERLVTDLNNYKSRIEDINERYNKTEYSAQDHQLSWQILNSHILQFQKSLISLIGYIKCNEYATPTELVHSLPPLEWYRHGIRNDGEPEDDTDMKAFQRLLQYNPSIKFDHLSSDCEQTLALCAGEVVVLVGEVCEKSWSLARIYLFEQAKNFYTEYSKDF